MRKYIRGIMRYNASLEDGKTTRVFRYMWSQYMKKKYGRSDYGRRRLKLFKMIGTGKSRAAKRLARRVLW